MDKFGLPELFETHSMLIAAYAEQHRRYHTLEHIDACFRHLDSVEAKASHPHEIELALWFHDAVYKIFSKSNEEDSAELAKKFLVGGGVKSDSVDRVCDLILITKDHSSPTTTDAELMLDIDLSILGAEPRTYEKFERDVREEYQSVPLLAFKNGRKEILQSFLRRRKIYHSSYFFDRLEARARENLSKAIETL